MCPRPESNRDLELRRFSFYPLNYKDLSRRFYSITIILFLQLNDHIFFDKGRALNYNKHRITSVYYYFSKLYLFFT